MKTLSLVCLLVPLIALADSSADKRLIGHWQYKDARNSVDMTFYADGTFTNRLSMPGMPAPSTSKGRWWVKGDVLYYEYVSDSSGVIPAGARDEDKLIEVTKDHFTIRTQHTGSTRTYKKVP